MQITIEPVQFERLPALVEISRKTFYDTFHQQNKQEDIDLFLNSSFNKEILKIEMDDRCNYFFFAKLYNEVVGYLKLSTAKSEEIAAEVLEISRIYVIKEKLGSGVGKALMEFAINFARQMGKKIIFLGVWEHNIKAIRFYEKVGFEKFGEHVFVVGKDAQIDWLMKKEL